jgi:hypothetical protein
MFMLRKEHMTMRISQEQGFIALASVGCVPRTINLAPLIILNGADDGA